MNFASRLMMLSQRAKDYLVKNPKPEMRSPLLSCWPEFSKPPNITDDYYYPLTSSGEVEGMSLFAENTMHALQKPSRGLCDRTDQNVSSLRTDFYGTRCHESFHRREITNSSTQL